MLLDDIKAQWEIDCVIDKSKLDDESIKSPTLYAKYLSFHIENKVKSSRIRYELAVLKSNKYSWYQGRLSKNKLADLEWEQYQFTKPNKGELEQLMDNDIDLINLKYKLEHLETSIAVLELILINIKDRTWSIRNAITFKQFEAGL